MARRPKGNIQNASTPQAIPPPDHDMLILMWQMFLPQSVANINAPMGAHEQIAKTIDKIRAWLKAQADALNAAPKEG